MAFCLYDLHIADHVALKLLRTTIPTFINVNFVTISFVYFDSLILGSYIFIIYIPHC